jgi:hypothetical protein
MTTPEPAKSAGSGQTAGGQPGGAAQSPIKIGELLVRSGLVSQENLNSSVSIAAKMNMPLGRILATHGYLPEELLVKSLEIVERIRSGQMSVEHGLSIVRAFRDDSQFEQVADSKQQDIQLVGKNQAIVDVLRKIGAITDRQKEHARQVSEETALPGGWVLVGQGLITPALLNAAIVCQRAIEKDSLPEERALAFLRYARLNQLSFQRVLEDENISVPSMELDLTVFHLLVDAGLLSISELLACRELAAILSVDLEQILWNVGVLDRAGYDSLKEVLAQLEQGLPAEEALKTIRSLKNGRPPGGSAQEVDSEVEGSRVLEMLNATGVLSQEDLDQSAAKAYEQSRPLLDVLLTEKLIEQNLVGGLLECQRLLDEGGITKTQALILVGYCAEENRTISVALNEFGWAGSRLIEAGR